jgi:hypothetical protein
MRSTYVPPSHTKQSALASCSVAAVPASDKYFPTGHAAQAVCWPEAVALSSLYRPAGQGLQDDKSVCREAVTSSAMKVPL